MSCAASGTAVCAESDAGKNAQAIGSDRWWIPRSPQDWNHLIAPLVQIHGAGPVYEVGEEVLGYPPTWGRSLGERDEIVNEMKRIKSMKT